MKNITAINFLFLINQTITSLIHKYYVLSHIYVFKNSSSEDTFCRFHNYIKKTYI